jgi:hypothetical protein
MKNMLKECLTQNVIPMKFKALLAEKRGQDSIVCTATHYGLDSPAFNPWRKQEIFSLPKPVHNWLWGPPSLLFNGYCDYSHQ